MLLQRDPVVGQNIFYIVAGKMNPEYLRVIFQVIHILLYLVRLIQHHVPGAYHLFHTVKPKMCFAVGNVQNLVVTPAFLPIGRQPFARFQAVSPAAAHNERGRIILEIQAGVIQIAGVNVHKNHSSFLSISRVQTLLLAVSAPNPLILCMFGPNLFMSLFPMEIV